MILSASLEKFIDGVLVREGWPKYTDDPADKGGPTKGGVTLKTLSRFRGTQCSAADVEALEETEVRSVYRKLYVLDHSFDLIADPWTFDFVVDTGVLQGQETAAKMFQGALGVPQDGRIGPTTMAAFEHADRVVLRKALLKARMHLLLDAMCVDFSVETKQTTNLKYRHGWWNRVAEFL